MQYAAIVTKEGKHQVAIFPDAPGCQTQADPGEDIEEQAAEALHGWLETMLASGQVPPVSRRHRAPRRARVIEVPVPLRLGVKVLIRQVRDTAGLTQAALAKRLGVTQPVVARWEKPNQNVTLETLDRIAEILGVRLELSAAERRSNRATRKPPARRRAA